MDKYAPLQTPTSGDELKETLQTPGYSRRPLNEVAKKPALQRQVRDAINRLSDEFPPTTKSSMYYPAVLTQEGLLSLAPDRIASPHVGGKSKRIPLWFTNDYLEEMKRIADTYGLACIIRKLDIGTLNEALINILKRHGFVTYLGMSEAGENKPSWIRQSKDGKVTRHTLLFSVIGKTEVAELKIGSSYPGNQNSLGQPIAQTENDLNNFKKWFGDSKAVDSKGRPLVLYHGTASDFSAFTLSKLGTATRVKSAAYGFFFVSDPKVASSYAKYAAETAPVERLLQLADQAEKRGDYDAYDKYVEQSEDLESRLSSERGSGQSVIPVYLRIQSPVTLDAAGERFVDIEDTINKTLRKTKLSSRNDGCIIRNLDDDPFRSDANADHFVVLKPEQIKSATGNKGTFDPSNADITSGVGDTEPLPSQPRVQPDIELGKELLKLQQDAEEIGNPYTTYEDQWTERSTDRGLAFDLNVDTPAERWRNASPTPDVNPKLKLSETSVPRFTTTEDTSKLVKDNMPTWKFGVIYEKMDSPTVSELMRDIINVLGLVPAGHRLCLVTPNPNELIAAFQGRFDIDVASPEVGSEVWKGYYTNKRPDAVPGTKVDYWKQVIPTKKSEVTMTPASENLVPDLPVKPEVLVPNGITPATRPVPPRTPAILAPQWFGWF
jgi:hypothetical protein